MSHRMRKAATPRRIAMMIATGVVVVAVLGGCSFVPWGGATAKAEKSTIENIEGVKSAFVYKLDAGTNAVIVTVAPGYRVGDATQALNWILETAWAINDYKPIDVIVNFDADGKPMDWDWQSAASQLGVAVPAPLDSFGILRFSASDLAKKYGPWPGTVPVAPKDLLVK